MFAISRAGSRDGTAIRGAFSHEDLIGKLLNNSSIIEEAEL